MDPKLSQEGPHIQVESLQETPTEVLRKVISYISDLDAPTKKSDGSSHGDGFCSGRIVGWIECKQAIIDALSEDILELIKGKDS